MVSLGTSCRLNSCLLELTVPSLAFRVPLLCSLTFFYLSISTSGLDAGLKAPEIVSVYALPISPSMIRLKIRQDFERNRHVKDLGVIDMLLHKNQQEYQETMNCWKQEVGDSRFRSLKLGCTSSDCSMPTDFIPLGTQAKLTTLISAAYHVLVQTI